MEITQREAARRLECVGLHRPAAVRLLRAGFAGAGRRVGGGRQRAGKILYEESCVDALVQRPWLVTREPERVLSSAAIVLRAGQRRADPASAFGWSGIDLTAPPAEQLEAVRRTRCLAIGHLATVILSRRACGRVPLVVTMAGFVALGAEVVSVDTREGRALFQLTEAGSWFEALAQTRLWSGPGAERRWLTLPTPEEIASGSVGVRTVVEARLVTP